jgi:hypothetical protein
MLTMIAKRMMLAIPSIIGVIIVTFLLTRVLPGDTAAYFAGPAASAQAVEEVRKKLGLDQPIPVQFASYVGNLARGDLGASLTTGRPVVTELAARLPAALQAAVQRLEAGESAPEVTAQARAELEAAGFDAVQYVEVRHAETLAPVLRLDAPARVLAAVMLGKTRLIDNWPALPSAVA